MLVFPRAHETRAWRGELLEIRAARATLIGGASLGKFLSTAGPPRLHEPRGVAGHLVDFDIDASPAFLSPQVVTARVWGIRSAANVSPSTHSR